MNTVYKSVDDVYTRLNQIPMFSEQGKSAAKFSLEAIRLFSKKMGNPHLDVPSIHVAGTNGKGTTCRMLASVYQSAGYKTGLFTSPHLIDYKERFMINGEMISDQNLVEFFRTFEELLDEIPLTYFELSAAIAFWYFSKQQVEMAIYETGLGGRLDATNILQPELSVITSIGMDHSDILGNTISEIAEEKGGIIKYQQPLVIGILPDEAKEVVKKIAREKYAALIIATEKSVKKPVLAALSGYLERESLSVRINLPIVISVADCLSVRYPVSLESLHTGVELWKERYPAGISFKQLHPDIQWYFDGAHNTEAINLLMCQLQEISPLSDWTFVFAMMRDKLNTEIGNKISESGTVYYYSIESERSASLKQMKMILPNANELSIDDDNMLTEGWIQKYKSELVIFGGSFYFYKTVKRWMENIAV